MADFEVGQKIRAPFPLLPDRHVDLVRDADGWRRLDGDGPRVPYKDKDIIATRWVPLDADGQPVQPSLF